MALRECKIYKDLVKEEGEGGEEKRKDQKKIRDFYIPCRKSFVPIGMQISRTVRFIYTTLFSNERIFYLYIIGFI